MQVLLIPIHIDALRLEKETPVRDAVADFSRLPYFDGTNKINGNTPFLSESIAYQPFENPNLSLPEGTHLHWALPDGLIKGEHSEEGTRFATVPNRWLVTKRTHSGEKQWIIESDYLHPQNFKSGAVCVPHMPDREKEDYKPFRFLGRKLPLKEWEHKGNRGEYVPRLTAFGFEPDIDIKKLPSIIFGWQHSSEGVVYRDPFFSAYYPNCRSVFGAHDEENCSDKDVTYEVLGWYSNQNQDPLYQIIEKEEKDEIKRSRIKAQLGWHIEEKLPTPLRTLCFGRITFTTEKNSENPALLKEEKQPARISLAGSGIEAISAYLAKTIDPDHKNVLEEQLEVLHLKDRLQASEMDRGSIIKEARHSRAFEPINTETRWELQLETGETDMQAKAKSFQAKITGELYEKLNDLNKLRKEYDKLTEKIQTLKEQTFADWCKYNRQAYVSEPDLPPKIEIKNFIEKKDLIPLEKLQENRGTLTIKTITGSGKKEGSLGISISKEDSRPDSTASRLMGRLDELQKAIKAFNEKESIKNTKTRCLLKRRYGSRYWSAQEPIIMVEGDACQATLRHGHDGDFRKDRLLSGESRNLNQKSIEQQILKSYKDLKEQIDSLQMKTPSRWSKNFPFKEWNHLPWNPLVVDWRAIASPRRSPSVEESFSKDFIADNYQLNPGQMDLTLKQHGLPQADNTNEKTNKRYSGTAILTSTYRDFFRKSLENYIREAVLKEYCTAKKINTIEPDYINENIEKILTWYKAEKLKEPEADDPVYTAMRAYRALKGKNCLSQALGGFNDALLMQSLTMQAPVCDPLADPDYEKFSKRVSAALGVETLKSSLPLNAFLPLRSGGVNIQDLRLVDSFGRTRDLKFENLITPERLSDPESPNTCTMPPRIIQPMRLEFRWLSARKDFEEMTDSPADNPICGWVLVNNYSPGLMIYDGAGNALGSLVEGPEDKITWKPAPGKKAIQALEISNQHLRKTVNLFIGKTGIFLNTFMDALMAGLENIEPENRDTVNSMSLLIGRPMALVRTSVDLQIMGSAKVNQSWTALKKDKTASERTTAEYTKIKIPLRIGEHQRLNSGLAGYWLEDGDGHLEEETFYSLQKATDDYPAKDKLLIKTLKKNKDLNIYQSIDDEQQTMTMLFDPRGSVHAASGIVPAKSINIPAPLYAHALESLYVTFLTSPILSGQTRLSIPLPEEPGFSWSWLEKESRQKEQWLEVPVLRIINKQTFIDQIEKDEPMKGKGRDVWNHLNKEDSVFWLTPLPDNDDKNQWARIIPKEERKAKSLTGELQGKEQLIQKVFDLHYQGIGPVSDKAHFTGKQVLREGWLKLSQSVK